VTRRNFRGRGARGYIIVRDRDEERRPAPVPNEREPAGETNEDAEPVADLPAQTADEVTLEYLPEPPADPHRRIHERGRLPAVPEGPDEPDPSPSPPADLDRPPC
jgi:hypothetical protein